MGKQVILLAGLHKTATTSIQRACAANQGKLLAQGFAYPLIAGRPNHSAHFMMFRASPNQSAVNPRLRGMTQPLTPELRALARENFAANLANMPHQQVFVAESVSLFTVDELAEMKYWFEENGRRVRLLCSVRQLRPWIDSMVAQRVNAGPRLSIAEVVDEFVSMGSLVQQRLENLRMVFPDAEFFSFDRSVRHP